MKAPSSIWPLLIYIVLVSGCATRKPYEQNQTPDTSPLISVLKSIPAETDKGTDMPRDDGSIAYQQALAFHQLIQGTLDEKSSASLIKSCNTPRSRNPFCFSVSKYRILKHRLEARKRVPRKFTPPVNKPIIPEITPEGVVGWRTLRRAKLEPLLLGLKTIDLPALHRLRKQALSERFCPNNIAIAVAATMEDYLPDQVKFSDIAELYQKCSRCFLPNSTNREHFITRAGLFFFLAKQYEQAERSFRQAQPTDAYIGRSTYWLYRTYLKLGNTQKAQDALRRLIIKHPLSFHTLVAMISSNQKPEEVLFRQSGTAKNRSKRSPSTNRIITQIEILEKYGFKSTANFLIDWAGDRNQPIEPGVWLYLAQKGDAHFKVRRLSELFYRNPESLSRPAIEMAYPRPYQEAYEQHSLGRDPLISYAISRRESLFDTKATSNANAQGLMQINPTTAERISRGMAIDLYNPSINVALGAFHLDELLSAFSEKLHWALASYNAGQDATQSWIRRFSGFEPILQMDLITFRETRNFVAMVLTNYYWYRHLYANNPSAILKPLLVTDNTTAPVLLKEETNAVKRPATKPITTDRPATTPVDLQKPRLPVNAPQPESKEIPDLNIPE